MKNTRVPMKSLGVITTVTLLMATTACGASSPEGDEGATESSSVQAGQDAESEPRLYKYGSAGSMGDAPMFVAKELGYFEEAGLNVEISRLKAGPVIAQSLTTGDIDAGAVAAGATLFNAFAQGFPLKMVADRQSNQGDHGLGIKFLIRTELAEGVDFSDDDEIAAMLTGKRLIESAKGSSVDLITRDLLTRLGMTLDDVTIVESGYSEGVAAIAGGSIDGGYVIEPFASQSIDSGFSVEVPGLTDVLKQGSPIVPLVFAESLLDNREDGEEFLLAYLRGAVYVNDAFFGSQDNYEEVLEIVSEGSGVDMDTLRQVQPQGIDPWNPIDLTFMERLLDLDVELGLVPNPPNLEEFVDNSFIESAVPRMEELGLPKLRP